MFEGITKKHDAKKLFSCIPSFSKHRPSMDSDRRMITRANGSVLNVYT